MLDDLFKTRKMIQDNPLVILQSILHRTIIAVSDKTIHRSKKMTLRFKFIQYSEKNYEIITFRYVFSSRWILPRKYLEFGQRNSSFSIVYI